MSGARLVQKGNYFWLTESAVGLLAGLLAVLKLNVAGTQPNSCRFLGKSIDKRDTAWICMACTGEAVAL